MKKYLLTIAVALMTAFAFTACSSDDDDSLAAPKDVSVTASADVKDYSSVVLKGYAYGANGKVGFCYSETDKDPKPESSNVVETSSLNADNSYELTIGDLIPKTTYYYRAYATKDGMKVMAKEVKTFTTEEFMAETKAVDLGLSVKWAGYNIGATKADEYGDYFAWGETKPYYTDGHSQDSPCTSWRGGKTGYDYSSYFDYDYTKDGVTYFKTYSPDKETKLKPEHDAAHVNWGGSWRMPTKDEMKELVDKCSWTLTSIKGKKCCVVKGPNGNSIVILAAGYRLGDKINRVGETGQSWTSSLSTPSFYAWGLTFYSSSDVTTYGAVGRPYGIPVRAVCP